MSEMIQVTTSQPINIFKQTLMPRTSCSANEHANLKLINSKRCGVSYSNRIIGGEEAEKHELPWLGLLKFRSTDNEEVESFMCSGTLISPRYVLTGIFALNLLNLSNKIVFQPHTVSWIQN